MCFASFLDRDGLYTVRLSNRSFVPSLFVRFLVRASRKYIYRRDRNIKKDVSVKYVVLVGRFYSVGERISYNTGVEIKERLGKSMCGYITTRLDRIRINGKRSM